VKLLFVNRLEQLFEQSRKYSIVFFNIKSKILPNPPFTKEGESSSLFEREVRRDLLLISDAK